MVSSGQSQKYTYKVMARGRKEREIKRSRITVIGVGMPSIEFWFLIHYLNTSKYFNDSKEVIQALRRWLPEYSKSGAMLEKPQWVLNLCSEGKLEKARATAESLTLESPSYSNIHKAIELFEKSNKV